MTLQASGYSRETWECSSVGLALYCYFDSSLLIIVTLMTLLLGQIVVNFWWLDFRRSEIAHYRHFEIWNYFAHSQTRTEVWLWKFEIRSLVSKEASTGKFYCAVSLLEVRTRTRGENHGKQLEIVFWLCTIFNFFPWFQSCTPHCTHHCRQLDGLANELVMNGAN